MFFNDLDEGNHLYDSSNTDEDIANEDGSGLDKCKDLAVNNIDCL